LVTRGGVGRRDCESYEKYSFRQPAFLKDEAHIERSRFNLFEDAVREGSGVRHDEV
jgi:hypothetical protein